MLLEKGAHVEAAQTDGKPPLLTAAAELSDTAACPDSNFRTSKRKAERESSLDTITRMLLEYGADPTMRDKHGKTPLEWVPEKYTELRALLGAAEAEWTSSPTLRADHPLDTKKDKLEMVLE